MYREPYPRSNTRNPQLQASFRTRGDRSPSVLTEERVDSSDAICGGLPVTLHIRFRRISSPHTPIRQHVNSGSGRTQSDTSLHRGGGGAAARPRLAAQRPPAFTHSRPGPHRRRRARPSGSGGAPARAAMRVGRPEITAIRALQVHQRPLVAQQVLPVRIAVSAVPAITTFGAVIAARAGQPCAAAAVGGRINR